MEKEDYFGLHKPFWNDNEKLQENKITLIIFCYCFNTSHTENLSFAFSVLQAFFSVVKLALRD